MLSEEYISTTEDLLRAIEYKIKQNIENSNDLRNLKFVSLGYARNPSGYPHLVITPYSEETLRVYTSNSICDINRTIRFTVYSYKSDQKSAFGQALGLINTIKDLFMQKYNNPFWEIRSLLTNERINFDTNVDKIVSPDPMSYLGGILSQAYVDITFLTQSKIDIVQHIRSGELYETNTKELTKICFEILEQYKNTYLSEINTFKYGITEPVNIMKFPAVSCVMGYSTIQQKFASVDVFNATLTILLFTDLFGNRDSLYKNVNIINKIKNVMFANKYMFNRCFNHKIGMITYNVLVDEKKLQYASQLDIDTQSYEKLS